ncbi:MAG: leucyl/phenylalanyl-tRNA--protein transferase, partial [Bacteroidota bacterium]
MPVSEFFSPEILIRAYQEGFFPMAESRTGEIYWHSPDPRAIIPLEKVKLPRSLKQSIKKYNFRFTVNNAFEEVISACADREETWISDEIIENYLKLHHMG